MLLMTGHPHQLTNSKLLNIIPFPPPLLGWVHLADDFLPSVTYTAVNPVRVFGTQTTLNYCFAYIFNGPKMIDNIFWSE